MNSFFGWIGGKNYLKKEIVSRFPKDVSKYVEVFGGAAWVLFYQDQHAEMEIYNDYNNELVNLFRCVKYHCKELQREMQYVLNSREFFNDFKEQYQVRGLTDIQRAARFFMIMKTSYGSNRKNYGCIKKDINAMVQYLDRIQERLSKVVIENKDFEDLMKVYDRTDTLFYLDPPYYGTEKYYQVEFTQEDHLRLKAVIESLKGKFVLSYNDCEEIRELYKDYGVEEITRSHNLHSRYQNKEHNYKELLIKNY